MSYAELSRVPHIDDTRLCLKSIAKALDIGGVLIWQGNIQLEITIGLAEVVVINSGNISNCWGVSTSGAVRISRLLLL